MLYVAKDVRGITPYALTFNDVGKSMLNEGGLIMIIGLLILFIIMLPTMIFESFSEGFFGIVTSFIIFLIFFGIPFIMIRKVSKLTDSDVPIDAFDKVDQRIFLHTMSPEKR